MKHLNHFIAVLLITSSTFCVPTFAQTPMTSTWVQPNNPSANYEGAKGIAIDGSGIFIVGSDQTLGNDQWRIEKRDFAGVLMGAFNTTGVLLQNISGSEDDVNGIAIDGTGIYVVGIDGLPSAGHQWRMQKRNFTTGVSIWNVASDPVNIFSNDDVANAVAVDPSGVYVVGWDNMLSGSGRGSEWRIEKRTLAGGATIGAFGTSGVIRSDPTANEDAAQAIAVDATSIYVGGHENNVWRIEKRDKTTGALTWSQTSVSGGTITVSGIAVDASGVYVVGSPWIIEKRLLGTGALDGAFGTGGVVNVGLNYGSITAVKIDPTPTTGGLYITGWQDNTVFGTNSEWRMEKRDLTTGALLCLYTNDPQNTECCGDNSTAITLNTTDVYVAGSDAVTTNYEWRIEKYSLCATALPIELLSFTGNCNPAQSASGGKGVTVQWSTASEINNDYFTIERSADAVAWETAGTVKGAGNSSFTRGYEFTDVLPTPDLPTGQAGSELPTLYYRLKQTDFDGKSETFNPIAVEMNCGSIFTVFPNPTNGPFNVSVNAKRGDKVLIVVRDVLGKEFYSKADILSDDKAVITVNPEGQLASGVYMVVATSNDKTYYKKKIVIR